MKKLTFSQLCTYGSIGVISSIAVLSTTTSAFTQVVNNSPIRQTSIPASDLIWPTQGFISQGFRKYQHEGIDIAGASGTPIVAVASGTVVKAGWDNWGLGNYIEIKHPDGSLTVYGHNRRLLVSKNQQVSQGQVIAEMGSTGNSTAPHLHFEFHRDGRLAVDPLGQLFSSTTSKIPTQPITTSVSRGRLVSKPPIAQQILPSQPIPISFAPIANTECSGITVIEGETANIRVKVCDDHGHLFYVGQLKQDPSQPVKIPAWNIGKDTYQANNGSFSYLVNRKKVEVWRNGSQIRSDHFHTFTR